ncbi:MAG: GGDEF domain-containing protein [Chloroflexi bacterium]|nr:GGDEF domain-containing protein [Chloroflexota bacterium]
MRTHRWSLLTFPSDLDPMGLEVKTLKRGSTGTSRRSTGAFRELAVILIVALLTFIVASSVNLTEEILRAFRRYEGLQVDELVSVIIVLALAFAIFSFRRWRELNAEMAERRQAEVMFKTLSDSSPIGIYIVQGGKFQFVNPQFRKVTGLSDGELAGRDSLDLVLPEDRCIVRDNAIKMLKGQQSSPYEFRVMLKGGQIRWIMETVASIQYRGKQAALGNFMDVTENKEAHEIIEGMAYRDPLTGLPNRLVFNDRLTMALALAQRNRQGLSVMFLDLDRFKHVNDTLGHTVGDRLLCDVAARLQGILRKSDTIARMGGDELMLLMPDVARQEDAAVIARKILEAVRTPFLYDGYELRVTTSIGIAIFPDDGEDAESLMRNADTAMYRAKELGRDNFRYYSPVTSLSAPA